MSSVRNSIPLKTRWKDLIPVKSIGSQCSHSKEIRVLDHIAFGSCPNDCKITQYFCCRQFLCVKTASIVPYCNENSGRGIMCSAFPLWEDGRSSRQRPHRQLRVKSSENADVEL
ncbi:hypothetical protein NPIL_498041 [Nephila pilipes]|uniref:Uncharacterized protein n=1 Tax=Nephila pilipes TaxID=299642 RepID=A0A8X6MXS8_NEPPI|nr:hypothetical protein NPIL_498041 [Nephila pilipes]